MILQKVAALATGLAMTSTSAYALNLGIPLKKHISNQLVVAINNDYRLPTGETEYLPLDSKASIRNDYKLETIFSRGSSDKSSSQFTNIIIITTDNQLHAEELGSKLERLPEVKWVEPNYTYEGDPRDAFDDILNPLGHLQLHHKIVKSSEAWDINEGSSDIVIAVTDDGVDINHPDLSRNIWHNEDEVPGNGIDDDNNGFIDDVNGWNFADGNPNVLPTRGSHGTSVSGVIAATKDNNEGGAGVAPGCRVMPLKFVDGVIPYSAAQVARSYAYAVQNGANIINTSYNIDTMVNSQVYLEAVKYAYENDVLIFNSAGNNRQEQPKRVAIQEVLFVAATDIEKRYLDQRSYFSNYGVGVDISAPGADIHTTIPNGFYAETEGTSFAAPMAAGAAALIWSHFPNYTSNQVWARLAATSDNIDDVHIQFFKGKMGAGRINLHRALSEDIPAPTLKGLQAIWENRVILSIDKIWLNIRSVLDDNSINQDGALELINLKTNEKIEFASKSPYRIGTNIIKMPLKKKLPAGKYQFRAYSDMITDPFGQNLDGDGDGYPGGDFVVNFSVSALGEVAEF